MIFKCADCGIMISFSSTGYGDKNTMALFCNTAFGEQFATRWSTCGSCGKTYCDKCASKRGGLFRNGRCECGGELSEKYNATKKEVESRATEIIKDFQKKKSDFDKFVEKGSKYFNDRKYPEATEWLGKAINLMPEMVSAGLYFLMSEACCNIGKNKLAIKNLTEAIKLEPQTNLFYGNRGICHFEIGDYESSINDFTKSIELDPNDAMSYNNRGAAYSRVGNFFNARLDYERALKIDPTGEAGKLARSNLDLMGS
jgi:tetratricopeptide (TPR) repeat protein